MYKMSKTLTSGQYHRPQTSTLDSPELHPSEEPPLRQEIEQNVEKTKDVSLGQGIEQDAEKKKDVSLRQEIEQDAEKKKDVSLGHEIEQDAEKNPEEDSKWICEDLMFFRKKVIGQSGTTYVFEGLKDGKPVAVKRVVKDPVDNKNIASPDEIKLVMKAGHHRNIASYQGHASDEDFFYIALERCDCNLDDVIQISSIDFQSELEYELVDLSVTNGKHFSTTVTPFKDDKRVAKLKHLFGDDFKLYKDNRAPLPLLLKLMRDMVSGLVHLHQLGIVHRDLKPQNILIVKEESTLRAKISDMGISRILGNNRSSLTNHYTACGTMGWRAPERLRLNRQTRKLDVFVLGCVLFACLTTGKHPFGEDDEREKNIKSDSKQNLSRIHAFPEAFHLISSTLEAEPKNRPTAVEMLHHPLFWDSEKRLSFLCETSERASKHSDLSNGLKSIKSIVLVTKGNGWLPWRTPIEGNLDDKIIRWMRSNVNGSYNIKSVPDLLQLIQRMLKNYEQLPKDIQVLIGQLYEGFDHYFTSRFPKLLIEVYKVVCTYCKEDEYFKKYFKENL